MSNRETHTGNRVAQTSKRLDLPFAVEVPLLVHLQDAILAADLYLPDHASGIVIFAHGSHSNRFSPRSKAIAEVLRSHSFGTLLVDLLMPDEEMVDEGAARYRFDIPLIAERIEGAAEWLEKQTSQHQLPIGVFGSSTGAGAAIVAAAHKPGLIKAIVTRGGRVDLASKSLPQLKSPTLMIVGDQDTQIMSLTGHAQRMMRADTKLTVVEGASHQFEEPGKLNEVAHLAATWFMKHLAGKELVQ